MLGRGVHKKLNYSEGKYFVDIDISVAEWKEMLINDKVFNKDSLYMVLNWYLEEDHRAVSSRIYKRTHPELKGSPYNSIVINLGKRILEFLNHRFYVESYESETKESFWSIVFEGWHVDYKRSKHFVWKLRDQIIEAIDGLVDYFHPILKEIDSKYYETKDGLTSEVYKDGKVKYYYTKTYERNRKNRDLAIKHAKQKYNNLICEACGFDFEATYGERGKDFIEIHHNKPLSTMDQEIVIDWEKDLNCLCSNCHRMIHRDRNDILTVKQLKSIIKSRK